MYQLSQNAITTSFCFCHTSGFFFSFFFSFSCFGTTLTWRRRRKQFFRANNHRLLHYYHLYQSAILSFFIHRNPKALHAPQPCRKVRFQGCRTKTVISFFFFECYIRSLSILKLPIICIYTIITSKCLKFAIYTFILQLKGVTLCALWTDFAGVLAKECLRIKTTG